MSDNDAKRPVDSMRDGAIEVSIWKRETEKGMAFNTERSRSYLDKDGNWQKTHSIPERDLLRAARLDEQAYSKIQKLRDQDRADTAKIKDRTLRDRSEHER